MNQTENINQTENPVARKESALVALWRHGLNFLASPWMLGVMTVLLIAGVRVGQHVTNAMDRDIPAHDIPSVLRAAYMKADQVGPQGREILQACLMGDIDRQWRADGVRPQLTVDLVESCLWQTRAYPAYVTLKNQVSASIR